MYSECLALYFFEVNISFGPRGTERLQICEFVLGFVPTMSPCWVAAPTLKSYDSLKDGALSFTSATVTVMVAVPVKAGVPEQANEFLLMKAVLVVVTYAGDPGLGCTAPSSASHAFRTRGVILSTEPQIEWRSQPLCPPTCPCWCSQRPARFNNVSRH